MTATQGESMYTLHSDRYFQSPAQTVAVEYRMPQEAFPEHAHEFEEMVLVSQGCGIHIHNDRSASVGVGSVLFLRAKDCHAFEEVSANLNLTNVLYRSLSCERYVQAMQTHLNSPHTEWQIGHTTQKKANTLLQLIESYTPDTPANCCMREGFFLQLIGTLLQEKYCNTPCSDIEDRAWQMLNDLRANFTDEIDWEDMANRYFLSGRTLHRKIKEHTGMSPQRYLTFLRISHTRDRLQHSRDSITTIAIDSGFQDANHFSTLFRQQYGYSPSEFRRQGKML